MKEDVVKRYQHIQAQRKPSIHTMNTRRVKHLILALFTSLGAAVYLGAGQAQVTETVFTPAIPKTWDDQEMASLEIPLADPAGSPVHISADYYYRIPVRPIYKSYQVYE